MTQGFGYELEGDSLKGNHTGWFVGVIPSFPAENQQGSLLKGLTTTLTNVTMATTTVVKICETLPEYLAP